MGRPPKPIEHHRRVGRANGTRKADGRSLPEVASITSLRMADGVPDVPTDLGFEGRALWGQVWSQAITWLSPDSDRAAVELAARLADDLSIARRRYSATTDPADGRIVATFTAELGRALSRLGFDPTARSALGVAEVRAQSTLEKMIANRASR